jgi:LysM repeat protein
MHTQNNRFSWLFLALALLMILVLAPSASAEGVLAAPPPPGGKYTVRANDTLWEIANQHGITVAQLTAANPDVSPDALRPGQTLTIPTKTPQVSGAITQGAIYTVKPNDTLWNIASKHGMFVNDLLAANPGVDPQRLMAGQKLIVPGVGALAIPAAQTTPVSAKYTVRADDTLWDIAANYGLSLNELLAANPGVDPRRLMAGQQLIIPGITQEALATQQGAPPAAGDQAQGPVPVTEQAPQPDAPPPAEQAPQPEAAPPAAQPEQPPAPADINPMAQDLLNRVNERRAAAGRAALVWNPQLAAAAQAHAEDCAQRNRGSHVGSDGSRLPARLQRAGYGPYDWHGENWANARDVAKAMDMWWNEPRGADPHVRNILASRATEIGIGVARGAWGWYFITDFGSR